MVKQYVKRPVVIQALQWTGENIDEVTAFCPVCYFRETKSESKLTILTLEGPMSATITDYIIKGVKGEFYPCKEDIFDGSYNPYLDKTMSSSCGTDGCSTI